jgi:mono/diheme cytochrome c family protein
MTQVADSANADKIVKREEPELPASDPIVSRSTSAILLVSALLLTAVLAWALYDEAFGQRPWKSAQREFVERESRYLRRLKKNVKTTEREVRNSEEYQTLAAEADAARKLVEPEKKQKEAEVRALDRELDAITEPFQGARGELSVINYQIETAGESNKGKYRQKADQLRKRKITVYMPVDGSPDKTEEKQFTYDELQKLYTDKKTEKGKKLTEIAELLKKPAELDKKRNDYLKNNLPGLTETAIDSLLKRNESFDYSLSAHQINVPQENIVDRCEACHLGTREPLDLTPATMRPLDSRKPDEWSRAFVSHPNKRLLEIHNPDRFGCAGCHGGNGRATTTIEKAHGLNPFWLHPLHEKENMEAGCQQCHTADRVLDGAPNLTLGKDLFQERGCVGCHRAENFDRETDALSNARQTIAQLEERIVANERESKFKSEASGQISDEGEAQKLLAEAESLRVTNSLIAAQIDELNVQSRYLMQDQKKVGPNLKDVRLKLKKEWIPEWLRDPQSFRPGTKMPTFWRLDGEGNHRSQDNDLEVSERKAIAAYIWQESFDGKVAPQDPAQGNVGNGKDLFEQRGCMACHSIGDGEAAVGGRFAANLTRVGDKANFDYIVRWIYNPRERWAPYCPKEKRDLTRDDYEKKGLKFEFDTELHSRCPNDGAELQVQNMTVMPNFRLTLTDARDIAAYLFSLRQNSSYEDASYMDDPNLKAQGALLIKQYGCAGCHEIKGFEEEQRIGKELSTEGSTPIERLDFALMTQDAEHGKDPLNLHPDKKGEEWYNHKGFIEHKLAEPSIYDFGKEKEPQDRLRMPRPYLKDDWRNALTTFLLGSVGAEGANVPVSMFYNPSDRQKAVQEGWWVIKKYNCMGCHSIQIGQKSVLMDLPLYQQSEWIDQLPPRLHSEGARVDPEWLLRFLHDPSLSDEAGRAEPGRSDKTVSQTQLSAKTVVNPAAQPQGQGNQGQSNQSQSNNSQATVNQNNQNAQAGNQTNTGGQNAAGQNTAGQNAGGQNGNNQNAGAPKNLIQQGLDQLRAQPGTDRNGVRPYLKARMPTFSFSPNELRTLVRFFMAMSSQQDPYIQEPVEPLSNDERLLARQMFTSGTPCLKCHITGDAARDKTASAPNFLLASERLKPDWTYRWLLDPQAISPGTAMPKELFRREADGRWVLNVAQGPESFNQYHKDHARLLVRYMFLMTPEEQRALNATSPAPTAGSAPAPTEQAPPATAPAAPTAHARKRRSSRLASQGKGSRGRRSSREVQSLRSHRQKRMVRIKSSDSVLSVTGVGVVAAPLGSVGF